MTHDVLRVIGEPEDHGAVLDRVDFGQNRANGKPGRPVDHLRAHVACSGRIFHHETVHRELVDVEAQFYG